MSDSPTPAKNVRRLARQVKTLQAELQRERDKLWTIASNPFIVFGEASVTESGIELNFLGDSEPEIKLGLSPGSIPASTEATLAMMHPDDREPVRKSIDLAVVEGRPFDMIYRLADGRGGWRWIEGRAVPVGVGDRKNLDWVFINRDFTAQREQEASLRRSLEELTHCRLDVKMEKDKLWKLAADTFSLLGEAHQTEEGGIDLTFFGDGELEKKLGLPPGALPKNLDALLEGIHPDDKKHLLKNVKDSLASGEPFRMTYRFSDGHSGWRCFQARAVSLGASGGRHPQWLHDTIDITDQKANEEALRKSVEELRRLKARLQAENVYLREAADIGDNPVEIVGQSAPMVRVMRQIEMVAMVSSTVLVSGETGSGKELVARAVHQHSDRRSKLFVAVNCAALPSTLTESELFGHEKGAFTGAIQRRLGRFEQADGGTLFLDEVSELPLETQAKMLRVLQSGEFERVGGGRTLKTDVRIIAASNRDLEQAVSTGRFRGDLYHRLAVFPIHLPPLRERREDIPLLATHLVTQKARQLKRTIDVVPETVIQRLNAYDWPGNVRELANVLERAIILSPGTSLEIESIHLGSASPAITGGSPIRPGAAVPYDQGDTLQATERAHILRVCRASDWRIKGPDGAAIKLGLNPGTLYARMKKLGIRRPQAG